LDRFECFGGSAEAAQIGNEYQGFEDLESEDRIFFFGSAEFASAESLSSRSSGTGLINWTYQNKANRRLDKITVGQDPARNPTAVRRQADG
jgi:hypothetical protein